MTEKLFINGIEMNPGMEFGREITIEESENKEKLNAWLEEDVWEIKDG